MKTFHITITYQLFLVAKIWYFYQYCLRNHSGVYGVAFITKDFLFCFVQNSCIQVSSEFSMLGFYWTKYFDFIKAHLQSSFRGRLFHSKKACFFCKLHLNSPFIVGRRVMLNAQIFTLFLYYRNITSIFCYRKLKGWRIITMNYSFPTPSNSLRIPSIVSNGWK